MVDFFVNGGASILLMQFLDKSKVNFWIKKFGCFWVSGWFLEVARKPKFLDLNRAI